MNAQNQLPLVNGFLTPRDNQFMDTDPPSDTESMPSLATESSGSSSSDDENTPPNHDVEPVYFVDHLRELYPRQGDVRLVTHLEQYLCLIYQGRPLYFRLRVRIERVGRGVPHPSVEVNFVDNLPAGEGQFRTVFTFLAEDLKEKLLDEIRGALGWGDEEM
ncbi:hypothetical protein C8Q76DRAFT_796193 [Earliella scabrosa]|nr:hypothetical protein C8Q76DRAFT_796193 [Earliella scabrosa]